MMILKQSYDIELLSALYKELMEDQKADEPVSDDLLHTKMARFVESGEQAYIAEKDGETVGYALVDVSRTPPYLHHFYICRGKRSGGCGKAMFELLIDKLKISQMDLHVFVWNERGQAFWESLGFKPRSIAMRYQNDRD